MTQPECIQQGQYGYCVYIRDLNDLRNGTLEYDDFSEEPLLVYYFEDDNFSCETCGEGEDLDEEILGECPYYPEGGDGNPPDIKGDTEDVEGVATITHPKRHHFCDYFWSGGRSCGCMNAWDFDKDRVTDAVDIIAFPQTHLFPLKSFIEMKQNVPVPPEFLIALLGLWQRRQGLAELLRVAAESLEKTE